MLSGKIVVTGGAGFIGSNLVDALLVRGYNVVAIDDLSAGQLANLAHLEGDGRFRLVAADVRDTPQLHRLSVGADAIVHLAAKKIPRYSDALDTLTVNTQGTTSALEAARLSGAKLVLASTSDVYGKNPALPFAEEDDLVFGPTGVRRWSYAVSKVFDEMLCYAYGERHNVRFTILRFFGSYGPRQHLTWWGGPQGVFISAVLEGREVDVHGDGLQSRSFAYVTDTVSGIIGAMEAEAADGEVFNIGSAEEVTILELARRIKRLSGSPGELRVRFVPYETFGRYEDVRRRVPDLTKAKDVLGFVPTVSLDEGLASTIEWYRGLPRTASAV